MRPHLHHQHFDINDDDQNEYEEDAFVPDPLRPQPPQHGQGIVHAIDECAGQSGSAFGIPLGSMPHRMVAGIEACSTNATVYARRHGFKIFIDDGKWAAWDYINGTAIDPFDYAVWHTPGRHPVIVFDVTDRRLL